MDFTTALTICFVIGVFLEGWAILSAKLSDRFWNIFEFKDRTLLFLFYSLTSSILLLIGIGVGLYILYHLSDPDIISRRSAGVAFAFGFALAHLVWRHFFTPKSEQS